MRTTATPVIVIMAETGRDLDIGTLLVGALEEALGCPVRIMGKNDRPDDIVPEHHKPLCVILDYNREDRTATWDRCIQRTLRAWSDSHPALVVLSQTLLEGQDCPLDGALATYFTYNDYGELVTHLQELLTAECAVKDTDVASRFTMLRKTATAFERAGCIPEAVDAYHAIATHYREQGFLLKAFTVTQRILNLDPGNERGRALAKEILASLYLL